MIRISLKGGRFTSQVEGLLAEHDSFGDLIEWLLEVAP